MMTSEPASVVAAGSDSSPAISGVAASSVPLMPIQPHLIVPLQSGGPSPEPTVVERDEASEPKRLRIADEGWTADS